MTILQIGRLSGLAASALSAYSLGHSPSQVSDLVIDDATPHPEMPAHRDARSRGQLPTWLGSHPPTLHHHPRGRSAAGISDHTKHVPDVRAPNDLLTADELATQLRRSRDWVYRR
jgi:hypothetical protein